MFQKVKFANRYQLYNREAIVVEPAGAMSTALKIIGEEIKGKNVACLIVGNNDHLIEIKERIVGSKIASLLYCSSQRAGALKEFVADVLGPKDDIVSLSTKKNNRSNGPAVVGIELKNPDDLNPLVKRMKSKVFMEIISTINQIYFTLI